MKDMRRPAACGAAVQQKNTCLTYPILSSFDEF
jgi:hypothetical protein